MEPHQSFDHQRLWADPALVAGARFQPLRRARHEPRARRPGRPRLVAGRARRRSQQDPLRALSRVASTRVPRQPPLTFNAAFRPRPRRRDAGDRRGRRQLPQTRRTRGREARRRPRQHEVATRAGILAPGAIDAADKSDLLVTSLEHLLLLSMLQHESGRWAWSRSSSFIPPATPTRPESADAMRSSSPTGRHSRQRRSKSYSPLCPRKRAPPCVTATSQLRSRFASWTTP